MSHFKTFQQKLHHSYNNNYLNNNSTKLRITQRYLSPFAPGNFAGKHVLKLVEQFSDHCRAMELKLNTKLITGRTLCGLLIQMQNISLRSSGKPRKQF